MQAVADLQQRKWAVTTESIGALAHGVQRLVRLAYPNFNEESIRNDRDARCILGRFAP